MDLEAAPVKTEASELRWGGAALALLTQESETREGMDLQSQVHLCREQGREICP